MKTKKVDYLSYIICYALCVVLSKAGYSYPAGVVLMGEAIVFVCAQCEAKRCPYGSAGTVFGVLDRGRGACLSTVEQTAAGLGKYNMALLLFWISFLYGRI